MKASASLPPRADSTKAFCLRHIRQSQRSRIDRHVHALHSSTSPKGRIPHRGAHWRQADRLIFQPTERSFPRSARLARPGHGTRRLPRHLRRELDQSPRPSPIAKQGIPKFLFRPLPRARHAPERHSSPKKFLESAINAQWEASPTRTVTNPPASEQRSGASSASEGSAPNRDEET